jgi:hypothetical protein
MKEKWQRDERPSKPTQILCRKTRLSLRPHDSLVIIIFGKPYLWIDRRKPSPLDVSL